MHSSEWLYQNEFNWEIIKSCVSGWQMLVSDSQNEISKEKDEIVLDSMLFQGSHLNSLKGVD